MRIFNTINIIFRYFNIYYNLKIKNSSKLSYAPEDISIEVINTCNFKCSFCPQSDPNHFNIVNRSHLTPEKAETIIKKLRLGGVRTNVIHWTLDGEPFVNKKFHRICKIAIDYGFNKSIFSTNGYFMKLQRLKELPRHNNVKYTLCIDFCSDKTYFEKIRGSFNSWDIIFNNIKDAVNDPDLNHIDFKITDVSSYSINNKKELKRRLQKLNLLFPEKKVKIHTRVFHNAAGFLDGILDKKKKKNILNYHICPHPWASFVVASNGNVVVCGRDLEHKTVMGNILKQGLQEIWNGKKYYDLRKSMLNRKLENYNSCNSCDIHYDNSKFTLKHILITAKNRLGIFQ
tara:strand:- start:130 stop:1158 length:1029 start_codon:yes stop_codon:yes gene_type:complete